jgi:alpha-glucosidase
MQDVYEVAEVVANYSSAGIPLETMWTDSEYYRLGTVEECWTDTLQSIT